MRMRHPVVKGWKRKPNAFAKPIVVYSLDKNYDKRFSSFVASEGYGLSVIDEEKTNPDSRGDFQARSSTFRATMVPSKGRCRRAH